MTKGSRASLILVILVAAVAAALFWWTQMRTVAPPTSAQAPPPPEAPASAPAAPAEAAIAHPVEPAAQGPLSAAEVGPALTELLGRKAVLTFLQIEDFPRRVVATLDSLGSPHSAPALWPVNPTPGRFAVQGPEGAKVIAADNSSRYTPFVLFVEKVDTHRAVDLYVRMYPLLQRTYQELGYPKRYLNDRVIAVIDQLLATPSTDAPIKVERLEVKGPLASQSAPVQYLFADPALESLSAGQKILLRVGPVNARRLKAKLKGLREELLQRGGTR